jgi:hypothetical protein
MATLLKVLNNLADIKSAGGVALRVRTQASLLANRKRQAAFLGFLKNNTTSKPAWQEIVDFS